MSKVIVPSVSDMMSTNGQVVSITAQDELGWVKIAAVSSVETIAVSWYWGMKLQNSL